jgi:hypothetical protein
MIHNVSRDDYLLARGANPRTGIITPGTHSASSSFDEGETLRARGIAAPAKWRQRGDEWISLEFGQPTPIPTPAIKRTPQRIAPGEQVEQRPQHTPTQSIHTPVVTPTGVPGTYPQTPSDVNQNSVNANAHSIPRKPVRLTPGTNVSSPIGSSTGDQARSFSNPTKPVPFSPADIGKDLPKVPPKDDPRIINNTATLPGDNPFLGQQRSNSGQPSLTSANIGRIVLDKELPCPPTSNGQFQFSQPVSAEQAEPRISSEPRIKGPRDLNPEYPYVRTWSPRMAPDMPMRDQPRGGRPMPVPFYDNPPLQHMRQGPRGPRMNRPHHRSNEIDDVFGIAPIDTTTPTNTGTTTYTTSRPIQIRGNQNPQHSNLRRELGSDELVMNVPMSKRGNPQLSMNTSMNMNMNSTALMDMPPMRTRPRASSRPQMMGRAEGMRSIPRLPRPRMMPMEGEDLWNTTGMPAPRDQQRHQGEGKRVGKPTMGGQGSPHVTFEQPLPPISAIKSQGTQITSPGDSAPNWNLPQSNIPDRRIGRPEVFQSHHHTQSTGNPHQNHTTSIHDQRSNSGLAHHHHTQSNPIPTPSSDQKNSPSQEDPHPHPSQNDDKLSTPTSHHGLTRRCSRCTDGFVKGRQRSIDCAIPVSPPRRQTTVRALDPLAESGGWEMWASTATDHASGKPLSSADKQAGAFETRSTTFNPLEHPGHDLEDERDHTICCPECCVRDCHEGCLGHPSPTPSPSRSVNASPERSANSSQDASIRTRSSQDTTASGTESQSSAKESDATSNTSTSDKVRIGRLAFMRSAFKKSFDGGRPKHGRQESKASILSQSSSFHTSRSSEPSSPKKKSPKTKSPKKGVAELDSPLIDLSSHPLSPGVFWGTSGSPTLAATEAARRAIGSSGLKKKGSCSSSEGVVVPAPLRVKRVRRRKSEGSSDNRNATAPITPSIEGWGDDDWGASTSTGKTSGGKVRAGWGERSASGPVGRIPPASANAGGWRSTSGMSIKSAKSAKSRNTSGASIATIEIPVPALSLSGAGFTAIYEMIMVPFEALSMWVRNHPRVMGLGRSVAERAWEMAQIILSTSGRLWGVVFVYSKTGRLKLPGPTKKGFAGGAGGGAGAGAGGFLWDCCRSGLYLLVFLAVGVSVLRVGKWVLDVAGWIGAVFGACLWVIKKLLEYGILW